MAILSLDKKLARLKEIEGLRTRTKDPAQIKLAIALDISGSMDNRAPTGAHYIDLAKAVIAQVLTQLNDDERAQVKALLYHDITAPCDLSVLFKARTAGGTSPETLAPHITHRPRNAPPHARGLDPEYRVLVITDGDFPAEKLRALPHALVLSLAPLKPEQDAEPNISFYQDPVRARAILTRLTRRS